MAGKTRHYIVDKTVLKDAHKLNHDDIVIDRPTPWKIFLTGFLTPSLFGFVVMNEQQRERLLSNRYACYHHNDKIRSNGDLIVIHRWSLYNVIKFCIEGLQYHTFWKVTEWTWTRKK